MALERPTFERPLDLLERNKLIERGALAMLLGGPAMLAAAAAGVFPQGFLGIHLAILGLVLWLTNSRTNMRPRRRRARVRADREGVWANGELLVPSEAIADGFFQPRFARDLGRASSLGSSVRLVDRRGRILFEAEAEEREALDMLAALGLDPGSKRAEFTGSSPMYSTLGRNLLFVFGTTAATLLVAITLASMGIKAAGPLFPMLMVPVVLAGLLPSKIAIGVDGVLVRWFWQKKFIPMSQIAHLAPEGERTIKITLVDGRQEVLYTSVRRRNNLDAEEGSSAWLHRDAVLARMREALATFRARGPTAQISALVGKGTRTRGEWLDALGKLREAEGGYRDTVVRDEDLWSVVEDPSAPEDARAGAAMLLRRSLDEEGKARVRVAASAAASPRLRVALDATACEEDDSAVRSALEELADEDEERAATARQNS